MFRRTKTKLEKKDNDPTDNADQKSVKNELTEKYRKILGKKKNQESDQNDPVTEIDEKTRTVQTSQNENDKISSLIQLIKSTDKKILVPVLDVSTGIFTFPQLSEIGEDPNNVKFLEKLTSDSIDILEKTVYERITVCPQHPDSLQVNIRLYCPKCNSIDIEKLHLFEHKVCGFISETKSFGIANSVIICPSCKKQIKDKKMELRIPAMWYNCLSCMEKFDDVLMKMYCRKFDHSFDTNMAGTVSIPGYTLKDSQSTSSYDPSLISHIKLLLQEHKFISEENHSLKGKSGHYHNIDLIATNPNTDTLFVFVLQSDNTLDESRINSKIIQVLDCNPTKTIIIGKLSDKAKSLASRYDISIIGSFEKNEVLSTLEAILTDTFTTEKLENDNHQLSINELVENEIFEEEKLAKTEKLENNNHQPSINELVENEIFEEEKLAKTEKLEEENTGLQRKLEEENAELQRKFEEERLAERKKLGEGRLAERKKLEEERLETEKFEAKRLRAELLSEKQRLEQEMESSKRKFEGEILADKQKLEEERQKLEEEKIDSERIKAERLAERKRLEEEKKKVERIEAERLAERKQLESEILSERKRSESERQADRKKQEEEKFADQLKLKAEKQRLQNERNKVEKLESERQRLEGERKKAELLAAEKLEAEEKRKEVDKKQAAKKEKILMKLEETENQLRALKSSFDSDDEEE